MGRLRHSDFGSTVAVGALKSAERGVDATGRPYRDLFFDMSGDRLPNGEPDVDAQGEIVDYDAMASAIKTWDGRACFEHERAEKGEAPIEVGREGAYVADDATRRVLCRIRVTDPVVVRMADRKAGREELGCSWKGMKRLGPVEVVRTGGRQRLARRAYPTRVDRVDVTFAPARSASKGVLAVKDRDDEHHEEDEMPQPKEQSAEKAVIEGLAEMTFEEKTATVAAIFGSLESDRERWDLYIKVMALDQIKACLTDDEIKALASGIDPAPVIDTDTPADPPAAPAADDANSDAMEEAAEKAVATIAPKLELLEGAVAGLVEAVAALRGVADAQVEAQKSLASDARLGALEARMTAVGETVDRIARAKAVAGVPAHRGDGSGATDVPAAKSGAAGDDEVIIEATRRLAAAQTNSVAKAAVEAAGATFLRFSAQAKK